MKHVDEFRDAESARRLAELIHARCTRPWKIMEVCGGQTHSIVRYGIDQLLPEKLTLVHGPGCPVCVTPLELIDRALKVATLPHVTLCSFGDMLRVPGSKQNLLQLKAEGADIRTVYSPLDAVSYAEQEPDREFVFFAVGFETTTPTTALAVLRAEQLGLKNFSLLVSHVLVPPAVEAILSSPTNQVDGFLAPGHVCAVVGWSEYQALAKKYSVPFVVTGFEPLDILQGVLMCVTQLEAGRSEAENQYARVVSLQGNAAAFDAVQQVFEVRAQKWRGIGEIPQSGLGLRAEYSQFDAEFRFPLSDTSAIESVDCISGVILQGLKKPLECPCFGKSCTPETPLGATMVSSEGACAAYYRYRRVV